MAMDILGRFGGSASSHGLYSVRKPNSSPPRSSSSILKPRYSRRDSNNGGNGSDSKGENTSTDWDKAWSNFRKKGKKTMFSEFSPDKYVSWNPRPSDYPLSEEVDPIKRIERSNLMLWTSPQFTLVGAIILVTSLLIYTIIAPIK